MYQPGFATQQQQGFQDSIPVFQWLAVVMHQSQTQGLKSNKHCCWEYLRMHVICRCIYLHIEYIYRVCVCVCTNIVCMYKYISALTRYMNEARERVPKTNGFTAQLVVHLGLTCLGISKTSV